MISRSQLLHSDADKENVQNQMGCGRQGSKRANRRDKKSGQMKARDILSIEK